MQAVLTEIISLLVGGITGIAEGIGEGLSTLATSIFLTGDASSGYELSVFGCLIAVFGGISLAIGLSRLVVKWVASLGASRV